MITKIIASLVVFVLTTIIAYLFRQRQLYVVIPKLYRSSALAEEGTVSEITIFNRGHKVEEDIVLEIEQDIKSELLATNSSEITLINNKINIPRLHSKEEASLILMVEEGLLTDEKLLMISSKECKGKIFKNIEEVPPSTSGIAKDLIVISIVIVIFTLIPTIFDYSKSKWLSFNYPQIEQKGWSNISSYLSSDLQDSYTNQEFPIRLLKFKIEGKIVNLTYEVVNKSALSINVTLKEKNESSSSWYNNYEFNKIIEPLEKDIIDIQAKRTKNGLVFIEFDIEFGEDRIYDLLHKVKIKSYKNLTDNDLLKKMLGEWNFDKSMYRFGIIHYKKDNLYTLKVWRNKNKKDLLLDIDGTWNIEENKVFYKQNVTTSNNLVYINDFLRSGTKILNITRDTMLMEGKYNNIAIKEIYREIKLHKIN